MLPQKEEPVLNQHLWHQVSPWKTQRQMKQRLPRSPGKRERKRRPRLLFHVWGRLLYSHKRRVKACACLQAKKPKEKKLKEKPKEPVVDKELVVKELLWTRNGPKAQGNGANLRGGSTMPQRGKDSLSLEAYF